MESTAKTLLFLCAPIVGGTLLCLGMFYLWYSGRELRNLGVTAPATIVKKYRKDGGLENYYALCAYADTQGVARQQELKVQSRIWHGLRDGGRGAISYIPGRPESVSYGPMWQRTFHGWIFLFFSVAGGAMACIGLFSLIRFLIVGPEPAGE